LFSVTPTSRLSAAGPAAPGTSVALVGLEGGFDLSRRMSDFLTDVVAREDHTRSARTPFPWMFLSRPTFVS
jgi:hypothetical protein